MPKNRGYETAAFVAAYVLDSKWGLNQGFDYYFDKFDLSKFEKISLGDVQRPANKVIDEALSWLDKKRTRNSSPGSIYEKCLSLNPESSAAHNALASIYIIKNDSGRARKHVDAALAINPKLSNAQYNLAQILEKEGKTEEEMAAYLKELENSSHHFKAII